MSDAGSTRAEAGLAEGTVVDGRYRILGLLGEGGMGAVYRAEHLTMRRPVALKILHQEAAHGSARRFEREAFASGQLQHPHCVHVLDFGQAEGGTLYMAMELLEGETLRERERRVGPLPVADAVHLLRQILRAVIHAHAQGIVHRDLKPDNVVLTTVDGDASYAKVLDFGIAMLRGAAADREGGETLTQAGYAVGTPTYLSPEQAFGEAVDHRTDLYALGVMLFEMVAGVPPYRGANIMALLTAHATAPIPSLAAARPDGAVSPALEALVTWALAKRPDDRVPSAEAFLAALDALTTAPAASPPPASAPRPSLPAIATPVLGTEPTVAVTPAGRTATWPFAWLAGGLGAVVLIVIIAVAASSGGARTAGAPGATPSAALQLAAPVVSEDAFKAALHDLQNGATCEERKLAVQKLRGFGDKRAIASLKKARSRPRGGVLGIGASNTNACLRAAVDDAVKFLQAL